MESGNYYEESLNSLRLVEVYNTRIERIRQYLRSEIEYVKSKTALDDDLLEIGAGYGRILKELAPYARSLSGIDLSPETVQYGRSYLRGLDNVSLEVMDAYSLNYRERFDLTLCLQNGISAIKGNPQHLVERALQATREGGRILFSTYSPKIWQERVSWFVEQSEKGLIGEVDPAKTREGVIHCDDGFEATTLSEQDFQRIGRSTGLDYSLEEVDGSSLFLIITKRG
ncbi:MAG TPA: methyltransferase domain-containing protein [Candidatus Aminicenantes bacterium]|mgnify:FL=1|nr:methyltransferase domain-containing protein [Candidatus Aminicenantes bacterium]